MITRHSFWLLVLLAGASMSSQFLWAQGKPELAGFGGGITIDQGGGTHGVVGGTVGAEIVEKLRVFGELGYAPLGKASFAGNIEGVNVMSVASAKLYNFGGGIDYSFGSSKSKAAPYVVAALGVGHQSLSATGVAGSGTSRVTVDLSDSVNAVYFGVGGGVRLYAGKSWGIKPEFRYQRYHAADGSNNSALYTVGLFYQFGR